MICPNCQSEMRDRGDEHFPDCEDCGFVLYDAETIALREEVRREYEQARREYFPDPVPSYREYMECKK